MRRTRPSCCYKLKLEGCAHGVPIPIVVVDNLTQAVWKNPVVIWLRCGTGCNGAVFAWGLVSRGIYGGNFKILSAVVIVGVIPPQLSGDRPVLVIGTRFNWRAPVAVSPVRSDDAVKTEPGAPYPDVQIIMTTWFYSIYRRDVEV